MTVQVTESFVITEGNGITVTFPFPFPAIKAEHVFVFVNEQLEESVTVVLNQDQSNNPGGTVTFNGGAPASGVEIVIIRETPASQLTEYPESGRFPAAAHERALDKLTLLVQDYGFALSLRAIRVPTRELEIPPLPPAAQRAGLFLAFDTNGDPITSAPVAGEDGEDGFDPYISDGTDGNTAGNWVDINGDTGVKATGDQGPEGPPGDATQEDIDNAVDAHAELSANDSFGHSTIKVTGDTLNINTNIPAETGTFNKIIIDGKEYELPSAAHVVETNSTATSWYRKWSDGFIEQGGVISSTDVAGSFTFPTPFNGVAYAVTMTVSIDGTTGPSQIRENNFDTRDGTSVYWASFAANGASAFPQNFSWSASGY